MQKTAVLAEASAKKCPVLIEGSYILENKKKASKRLNTPGRALFAYLISGAVAKGIGVLTTPLFTRVLSGDDYGSVALYLSAVGVMSAIISPLASGSCIYLASQKFKADAREVTASVIPLIFAFCGGICTLLFTFKALFGFNNTFVVLISLQVFFDSCVLVYSSAERYLYHYGRVAAIAITEAVLSPLLSLLLLGMLGSSYTVRILGLLLPPTLLTPMILFFCISQRRRPVPVGFILRTGAPQIPVSLLGSLGAHLDRFLIVFLLGSEAIAKYSVAHTLGVGMLFLVTALCSALIPWTVRRIERGEFNRVGEISEAVMVFLAAGSFCLVALSPEIMLLLAPAEYSEAVYAVMPIALSAIPAFVSHISSAALLHLGHGRGFLATRIASLLTALVCGLAFIPSLGYFGAGLAALLSESCTALISYFSLAKKKSREILKMKDLRLNFLLLISVCAVLPLFYASLPLRIFSLIIPSVVGLKVILSSEGYLMEQRAAQKNIPH